MRQAVGEGCTATRGPRHADTLLAQAYLASTRLRLGDAAGAVALLEVAVPGLEAAADLVEPGVVRVVLFQDQAEAHHLLRTHARTSPSRREHHAPARAG